MQIAVIGANGAIGRCVVTEALARGHRVTAVVRRPEEYQGLAISVERGDVLDPADVARVAAGRQVMVSAVGGGDGPGRGRLVEPAAHALVAGLRGLADGAPRLLVVGSAGSLLTASGAPLWDDPAVTPRQFELMRAHGRALDYLRTVRDLDWTVLSPPQNLLPGERTGTYRTAADELVTTPDGLSSLSLPDLAAALVDELEHPVHHGERFTCGY
ncbi:NAD(P)-dependent oxidoreductase [Kitasatospora sp. NPDC057198]|uniref:NAD(P)-dependent oxidoreductase n=1 Tax=Kitasatospora sp. NPDC057198 TaxID=3346046 RepID=UPI00362DCA8A